MSTRTNATAPLRATAYGFAVLAVAALVGLVVWGWQTDARPYVVVSGSMAPAIDVGDAVVVGPDRSPTTGDVITFTDRGQTVTHRVIEQIAGGYRTQGDANGTPDPTPVPPGNVLGRVAATVPFGGYALIYLGTWTGLASVLLLPVTLQLGWSVAGTLAGAQPTSTHSTSDRQAPPRHEPARRSPEPAPRGWGLRRLVPGRRDRSVGGHLALETAAHRTGKVWS